MALRYTQRGCSSMFAGRPIIGITGGIGSGKSFVARLFGELGCCVVDSDSQVHAAYQDNEVRQTLRGWWGDSVLNPDGSVRRSAIAQRVFASEGERKRLEGLIHPWVAAARDRQMQEMSQNPAVVAFLWDTPLL